GEDRAGRKLQVALAQLVLQALRVGGQVAIGPQFDPGVAGIGGLVEETVPRHLDRVLREPDSPRVWCGSDANSLRHLCRPLCVLLRPWGSQPSSGRWLFLSF